MAENFTVDGQVIEKPQVEFTDMSQEKTDMGENLKTIGTGAETALKGITAEPTTYAGVDAQQLKDESALAKGSSYITPEATVQGQLQSLLSSDSQYMKTAEKRAKEQAASVGLLGSSMAVGAAQRAAIEKALPIAQQDAETYAKATLAEQQTSNEMSRLKAESDLSAAAREHIYDIDASKTKLAAAIDVVQSNAKLQGNAEVEAYLTKVKGQWDADVKETLAGFDAELQAALANQEISAREREWASTNASQVMASAYGSINDLLGNADFMAAYAEDVEGMNRVFNNFINFGKDQVAFIGSTAKMAGDYMGDTTTGQVGWIDLIGSWGEVGTYG